MGMTRAVWVGRARVWVGHGLPSLIARTASGAPLVNKSFFTDAFARRRMRLTARRLFILSRPEHVVDNGLGLGANASMRRLFLILTAALYTSARHGEKDLVTAVVVCITKCRAVPLLQVTEIYSVFYVCHWRSSSNSSCLLKDNFSLLKSNRQFSLNISPYFKK